MPSSRHRRRARRRADRRRVAALLRAETVGGALLIAAAALALIIANSPMAPHYLALRDLQVGPSAWHLQLSVQQWTADGLLAVFFFLAGLELKREFVAGQLRDPRRAAVPMAAAVGGMVVPAVIYLAINAGNAGAAPGWAIPTATDIAFALAVLAVVGRNLPTALRTFLLTLAVVDDLLAIVIIAVVFTRDLQPAFLLLALVPLGVFAVVVQRGYTAWWVLWPLAVTVWALVHASGVHATVAGVLMGLAVPVLDRRPPRRSRAPGRRAHRSRTPRPPAAGGATGSERGVEPAHPTAVRPAVADRLEHLLRPLSAAVAVPLFAFFAAGVDLGGLSGLAEAFRDRVTLGIVVGMVAGKTVGILLATGLTARVMRSPLLRELAVADLVGLAMLGGVGFTVSLLIGDLAFGPGSERGQHVPIAVLSASVVAAVLAGLVLATRNRHHRAAAVR